MMVKRIVDIGNLTLESGIVLDQVQLAYELVGKQDAPMILLCHALTGNQYAVGQDENPGWWSGLVGQEKSIDTNKFSIITFNILGGCSGSTGPLSVNPKTAQLYRKNFPEITIRDMVNAERKALTLLEINKVYAVVGGSLGGMRVYEWGIMYPNDMDILVPIAATPRLSSYGIAFNYIGLQAIENDPNYFDGRYTDPSKLKGFEIARMAGMITYRSEKLFNERFDRKISAAGGYEVESYLQYMGEKIAQHFDPNSYCTLLYAMNTHDVGRGRGGVKKAAQLIKAKVVALAFTHDLIYPPESIRDFTELIPKASYTLIETDFGHDGFLIGFEKWGPVIKKSLEIFDFSQSNSRYPAFVL